MRQSGPDTKARPAQPARDRSRLDDREARGRPTGRRATEVEAALGTESPALEHPGGRSNEALAVHELVEPVVQPAQDVVLLGLRDLAGLHRAVEVRLDRARDRALQSVH